MKNLARHLAAAVAAASLSLVVAEGAAAAPKPAAAPAPAASAAGSPAPLPTATPESADVAIPRLEAAIKTNPSDKDALQQLAGYYLAADKPDQALALTQRLLSLGSKNAQVYFLDGAANEALGHVKEATADFEAASDSEPTNAQVLLTLTDLYLRTNRGADAERIAKRATTFNATDKRVFENYGLVLGQEGKYDDARAQFETAAKLDPKDATPIVFEARSYISQKSLPLATQEFDRALAVDPKNADALLGKARLAGVGHDVKGAVATYETLLATLPNDDAKAQVLVEESQLYRQEKQNDQALAALKRAATAYPNAAAVNIALGDYDVAVAKDNAAAQAEWTKALGPNRANPEALQRLGELAESQGKHADALGFFKQLSVVAPSDPVSWGTLGQAEAQNNDFTASRDAFRHSFELARTPQALAGLGTADLQLKNYHECGQVFDALDKNAPDFMKSNPQLLYVYGKCAVGLNDRPKARAVFTRFKVYVKSGTPLAAEVNKTLASLGGSSAPAATAKPKAKAAASR